MIANLRAKFTNLVDPLIVKNRDDSDYYTKSVALFAAFTATETIMILYVLYCYIVFNGFNAVTTGGLIFTILHSLVPIVFYFSQSHIVTTLLISLTGLGFQTIFCIYTGGIFSPAAIWLALHPVILGFFGSTALIYFSVVMNGVVVLTMFILGEAGKLPFDAMSTIHKNIMIVSSFIGLDFLVAVFTMAAIYSYSKKNRELLKSKELTENLLRILAHDINNPLTILRYYGVDLMKNPHNFNNKVAERLNKSSEDIQKITESVTLWISHRDGKMELKKEPLNPKDLCHHLQLAFEEKLKQKSLALNFENAKATKPFFGDRNAVFYQVFNNLISNAIKFSYENTSIDIDIKEKDKHMEFIVRDHGAGISDDLCDKVFSPYASTNRLGTNNEKGTGFGLPIVGTIVSKLNGTIKIENVKKYRPEEQGTMITVTFPLAQ